MENKKLITGIDIGTTKIAVVIAECNKDNIHILGFGTAPSNGLKKGVIVTVFPDSCDRCYVNFGKFKEYYEKNQSHKLPKADG